MRKLIVSTYLTLDGRVDDLQEWALRPDTEDAVRYHTDLVAHSDGLLLGRRTYEIFAGLWPALAGKVAYADTFNRMAKHVVSTTLGQLDWENSHLVDGGVAEGVAALKGRPGQDLVVYGGLDLVHGLMEHDLVDEYRLLVHPVLLGKGRVLLGDGAGRVDLDLVDTTRLDGGVTVLTYHPAR
jgi:dihydrofolate reductase